MPPAAPRQRWNCGCVWAVRTVPVVEVLCRGHGGPMVRALTPGGTVVQVGPPPGHGPPPHAGPGHDVPPPGWGEVPPPGHGGTPPGQEGKPPKPDKPPTPSGQAGPQGAP